MLYAMETSWFPSFSSFVKMVPHAGEWKRNKPLYLHGFQRLNEAFTSAKASILFCGISALPRLSHCDSFFISKLETFWNKDLLGLSNMIAWSLMGKIHHQLLLRKTWPILFEQKAWSERNAEGDKKHWMWNKVSLLTWQDTMHSQCDVSYLLHCHLDGLFCFPESKSWF